MITKNNITGIILAGGKSSRMGSDKGLLMLHGKPFIQHIIDALQVFVSEILIVSNNTHYDLFGYKRIEDVIANAGPLAGVYSGLNASRTTYSLVLSCDIPLISPTILKKLIAETDDISQIVQVQSQSKTMPLIALYKDSCKDSFLQLLKIGERRLQFAVNQCQVKTISLDTEDEKNTLNVNTPEELKTITNDY